MPLPVTIHNQEPPKDEIIRHNGMTEMYGCTTVFAVGAFGIAPSNGKYHCPLFGPCYRGPAINAKQIQCAQQALRQNAVSLGLDAAGFAAGFLPGGDTVVAVAQIGLGAVSTVNGAVSANTTTPSGQRALGGAIGSIFGIQLSALAPAAKYAEVGAKAVPFLGALVSLGGGLNDAYQAYADYQACLAGH